MQGVSAEKQLDELGQSHGLPKVTYGHLAAVCDLLKPGEQLAYAALARLDNPTAIEIAAAATGRRAFNTLRIVNEVPGGLLAVTDRRILYVGRTFVARGAIKRGNETIELPLEVVTSVGARRGKGSGDIRKVLSLTFYGSKLWIGVGDGTQEFIEIKPLDTAERMRSFIQANIEARESVR